MMSHKKTIAQRAAHARRALIEHGKCKEATTGRKLLNEHLEDDISDLLADIRHLCDSKGFNFGTIDRRAYGNYSAEIVAARAELKAK